MEIMRERKSDEKVVLHLPNTATEAAPAAAAEYM